MRGALLAGALTTGLIAVPAQAAEPICTSKVSPKVAKSLSRKIAAATRGRPSMSVALYDRKRKLSCWVNASAHYDSASTIKVTIVAALLRHAQSQKRGLTSREKALAKAAITRSDNNATSALWNQLGYSRVQRFVSLAGMRSTHLNRSGYWGLSQITAYDQLKLLMLLTRKDKVLTEKNRKYLLALMASVVRGQRWGAPAGAPGKVTTHVKNGWLPRRTHGWRVHSLGTFSSKNRDYMLVLLSHNNASMSAGIRAIEPVARAVHGSLNSSSDARYASPPASEVSDGSAPY